MQCLCAAVGLAKIAGINRRRHENQGVRSAAFTGAALARPPIMANKSTVESTRRGEAKVAEDETRGAVIVVGGSGGMSERYRAIVAERGLELRHFEKRVPNGTRRFLGHVAAVFIMVGMVSHSLRDQVQALVPEGAPIVYLRSASVSALRSAVASLDA